MKVHPQLSVSRRPWAIMFSIRLSLSFNSCSVVFSGMAVLLSEISTGLCGPRGTGASRLTLKQHVDAAMRRIAAHRDLGGFRPFAFIRQVHGIHNVRRPGGKAPRKAVGGHRKLRVEVMAVIVGAEAIAVGGIVVGDCGQGAEQDFAVDADAFALDEQDEPVKLILDVFRLDKMQRFARSTNDRDRPRPVAGKKSKLVHRGALGVGARWTGLL